MSQSEIKYEKYIKDDKVAILYSPGYGAGWSTWNSDAAEALIFDKELVELVLAGDNWGAGILAEEKYGGIYTGGASGLQVKWLAKGTRFEIEEYDGSESVRIFDEINFHVA